MTTSKTTAGHALHTRSCIYVNRYESNYCSILESMKVA